MEKLKTALLQTDIVWANPEKNIENIEKLMDANPDAGLYVLPEMFSTGFCTKPEGIAEESPAASLDWMKNSALSRRCAIAGSLAVRENGCYRNRFYFVHPDGKVEYYDKKHLFTYGDEHREFTAGDRRMTVNFEGIRILLEVCYDLRFPVWARNRGDYDMILYVANWPVQRIEAWKTLLRARAIENQCYVCGVNRVGADPYNRYCGGSALIGPNGNTLAECEDGKESAAVGEVDIALLNKFRGTFPVLTDADSFHLASLEQPQTANPLSEKNH